MGEYMGSGMYADIIFVGDKFFLPIFFLNIFAHLILLLAILK